MKPITLLFDTRIIVAYQNRTSVEVVFMLLLTAILRVWLPPEIEPNDLLTQARLRIGHVGLTVIALIFVLTTFWQNNG